MKITFIEQRRNNPHYSGWYSHTIDHIDTYFTMNGKRRFLRGIADCALDYEKQEMEALKKQLIANDAKYVRFYCHAPIDNPSPLDMIQWVRDNNLHWESFAKFQYIKSLKTWEFGGNTREYSAAFTFRIFDRGLAIKTKRAFSDSLLIK